MRLFIICCICAFSHTVKAQFVAEEKSLQTQTGILKATLLIPAKAKIFAVVVIQAGSGPTDRNGNSIMGIKPNSYRLIAEALAAKGIATLLMDKRGVAASAAAVKNVATFTFIEYATDLVAWVNFIQTDKRIKKTFIAGHSEGSLVTLIAAQKLKINGLISIAGAGEPIDKIIVWQYAQQLPKLAPVADSLFKRLLNKQKIDTVPPMLRSIFDPTLQAYLYSWAQYNPCEEIKKIKVPILILQGNTDLQVEVKEANFLKSCNPNANLKIIDGMNHILKAAPIDRVKNIAAYSDTTLPLMPDLIDVLVNFVNKK